MPTAKVRGATIVYEVLGSGGPWLALTPGGRRGLDDIRSLASRVADGGFRVLIHDRRNCGASDLVIEGDESEYEIWADDLYELLTQLKALPAWVGGRSSGCRMSLLFALRHPEAARGLLLAAVTGGRFACERLAENYYGQYITAAQKGGMAAVCATEHFRDRIAANPANRAYLMGMDVKRFCASMARWREPFATGGDLPMIGASEQDLRSLRIPTIVVPGNDRTHNRATGERVGKLIPGAETHIPLPQDKDADLALEDWDEHEEEFAAMLIDFMRRAEQRAA